MSCCTFVTSSLSELQVYTNVIYSPSAMLQIIESKRISLLQQLQLQVTISRTTEKAEQWVTALKWTCVMIMCSGSEDSSCFLLGLYERNEGHTHTSFCSQWPAGSSREHRVSHSLVPPAPGSARVLPVSTKTKHLCRLHVSGRIHPMIQPNKQT